MCCCCLTSTNFEIQSVTKFVESLEEAKAKLAVMNYVRAAELLGWKKLPEQQKKSKFSEHLQICIYGIYNIYIYSTYLCGDLSLGAATIFFLLFSFLWLAAYRLSLAYKKWGSTELVRAYLFIWSQRALALDLMTHTLAHTHPHTHIGN